MSAKPKDHRPKVISFRTSLDGLNIAARQNILWPCHAFSISIPQKKESGLNFFEETVLRLTEIESGDTNNIAGITCLEKELVSFIQNRLNHLGLVNDRYNLSDHGRELLNEWQNQSGGNLEYTVATVFVDLLSGKLLPYVHVGTLNHVSIMKIKNALITINMGNTGKQKLKICRQILPSKDSFWKIVPKTSDIIRAIREFKKKYKRYALLTQGIDQYPPPVPMAEAISVHNNPELVYLHCKVLIQIGNSDLLVTDGCGFGFSENFASYLTSQNWQWVKDIKKRGIIESNQSNNEINEDTKKVARKYQQITRSFIDPKRGIYKLLNELSHNPCTEAEEKDYIYKRQQAVSELYAALEWTLRNVISNHAVPEWEQVFISQNYRVNEALLCKFSEKIGFSVSVKNKSILQVKPGAIRQVEHGKVELQPLLAIAIAGAATKYTDHPFHTLARNYSDFLDVALQLKRFRDPVAHGDVTDFKGDKEEIERLLERIVQIIITLLPQIALELKSAHTDSINAQDDINQKRLKAVVELENNIGLPFVSEMSPNIKEQLIRSEMMLSNFTGEISIEIIKCFASIMQLALFEVAVNRKPSSKSEGDIRETAMRKIVESGFYSSAADIPKPISTVNVTRLHRAVQGSSTTLGAHTLAIFLLGSESELIQLKNFDSEFIGFVANLIRLRGHGNKQQYDFSRNDLESLKNNVFKAIKIITEVF